MLLKLSYLMFLLFNASEGSKKEKCEVCIGTLKRFSATLSNDEITQTSKIEAKFMDFCESTEESRERRFCYYLGGLVDSATRTLSDISKPLSWRLPIEKICYNLGRRDEQICQLRYKKKIDVSSKEVLMKQSIGELKRLLNDLYLTCEGCIEKKEFVEKIYAEAQKTSPKEEL
ncbi:hypothetical protein TNIN_70361 [Trichonephila inaurata madagascariensis]|uniref:Mesencephalic astrocyte-derived neurotrophic factor homolog n=1 Tax=Trichonephila inaurata madagascariensis TaxID=2747483 RepID=A0A8X6YP45_9ARAC|nr:hypothetical protein TNIN_70361 [Trichonephila inaurata madagascariensis]